MQSEEEKNRLRVLSLQQNIPLRIAPSSPYQLKVTAPATPYVPISQPQVPQQTPQPQIPQYSSFGARLRDIYQANSPQDIARRLAVNEPAGYREQQLAQGKRELSNPLEQIAATPLRLVNTAGSFAQQLPSVGKILLGKATGNKQAAYNAALQADEIAKRTLAGDSGIGGLGTLFESYDAANKATLKDVAKIALGGGAEIASFGIGGGAAPKLLKTLSKQGIKAALPFLGKEALAGVLGGGGSEVTRNPKATLKQVATAAAIGGVLAPPAALAGGAIAANVSKLFTTRASKTLLNRLVEETDIFSVKDSLKTLFPNLAEDELLNLSEQVAKSTTTDEVQSALSKVITEQQIPKTVPEVTTTKPALTAEVAATKTAQQLANTSNQQTVAQSINALFPTLDNSGKVALTNKITESSDPVVVRQALDLAEKRSKAITESIQQQTPPAPTVAQQQADAAARLIENPPIQTQTPRPVTATPEAPTPVGVQGATSPGGVEPPTPPKTTAQGAAFDAGDTRIPIPAEVTNYNTVGGQFQRAVVDRDAPLINYAKQLEKQTGEKGLVDQIYYVTGLQTRANAIANNEIMSSVNLRTALSGLDNVQKGEFDIFVAAKNELSNAARGLPTSRPVKELQSLVDKLEPEYGNRFVSLNGYYQDWALKMRQAGLIDEKTYRNFINNTDYTRIQRVFDDLSTAPGKSGNAYSFGTPSARQKRTGSLREIQPADVTAFDYGQRIQKEIQRNSTADTIINLLQKDNATRKISQKDAVRKNVLKRVKDGVTEYWEVPRDIKTLADNVTPFELGVLQEVIAAPQRILRAGATGLSAPFTVANFGKDIVSSAVFSKNARATHLNPSNILSGLKNASLDTITQVDDPIWNKFISIAGDTTSYDFLRNIDSAKELSRELRLGTIGKLQNIGSNPITAIKTLEDFNSITEKATRFSNFKGTYESILKQTNNEVEALRQATLAAWQNSTDFSRAGNVTQVINLLIPYFNAGVQGTRLLGRRFVENPLATSAKLVGLVGAPLMGATLYNLAEPERKKVYENISKFEKENNIIIVLPGAKQKSDGSYDGVIKIPLQPGLNDLVAPIRQLTERFSDSSNTIEVQQMLQSFFSSLTGPIDIGSINGIIGSITPQVIKPAIQQVMNIDLFTGNKIVDEYIQTQVTKDGIPIKESDKAYKYTSGTARFIGNRLGVSPIRVEKFIKDTTAKVGLYALYASDTLLNKAGVIPDEQVGGISVKEDFIKRFFKAQSNYNYEKPVGSKYYDAVKAATKSLTPNEKRAYDALHPQKTNILGEDIFDENKRITKYARAGLYLQFPKVFEAERAIEMDSRRLGNPANPIYDLPVDQLTKVLLKATLPPGAKDPELSNLYSQEWYQDFNAKRDIYYTELQNKLTAEGKKLPESTNPYPSPTPELQQVMNMYSKLPKGNGTRSAWINSNPELWKQMTDQFAAVDAWENKERVSIGLSPIENVANTLSQFGYKTSSPEYQAALAFLQGIPTDIKPLSIISAAPKKRQLARLRLPSSGRTARIRLQ